MNIQIRVATADEIRSGFVGRKLRELNHRAVGGEIDPQSIHLNAVDGQGAVVGGIRSYLYLYWLRIELLWVHDDHRGRGVGSRLLKELENRASVAGARNALVETFEWQAPKFYEKHGYQQTMRIDDYADGQFLAFMRKTL